MGRPVVDRIDSDVMVSRWRYLCIHVRSDPPSQSHEPLMTLSIILNPSQYNTVCLA
jgi:hypothetical protein